MTIEIEEISNGLLLRFNCDTSINSGTIYVESHKELLRKIATLLGGSALAETITFE